MQLHKGDHATIAGVFPWIFEQGLDRLRDVLGLIPVVMPNCLNTNADQKDRANDLHNVFLDQKLKAIFSCTGGIRATASKLKISVLTSC